MAIGTILAYIIAGLAAAGCFCLVCGAVAGLITTIREPKNRSER